MNQSFEPNPVPEGVEIVPDGTRVICHSRGDLPAKVVGYVVGADQLVYYKLDFGERSVGYNFREQFTIVGAA